MASTMDPLASERYTVVLEAEKLTRLQRAFRLAVWMVFESPASADVYGDATGSWFWAVRPITRQ